MSMDDTLQSWADTLWEKDEAGVRANRRTLVAYVQKAIGFLEPTQADVKTLAVKLEGKINDAAPVDQSEYRRQVARMGPPLSTAQADALYGSVKREPEAE